MIVATLVYISDSRSVLMLSALAAVTGLYTHIRPTKRVVIELSTLSHLIISTYYHANVNEKYTGYLLSLGIF